ncbi:MAG: DUF4430 domain-containing protein [Firmicutes bacterium]|nr:DUF4430 domain-containing protein [Bacillota bacterium]
MRLLKIWGTFGALALLLLVLTFVFTGKSPKTTLPDTLESTTFQEETQEKTEYETFSEETTLEESTAEETSTEETTEETTEAIEESTEETTVEERTEETSAEKKEETVPEKPVEKEAPSEKEDEKAESISFCTLSVRCDTILNNKESVKEEILEIVPKDGCILEQTDIELKQGDSVFDLLKRALDAKNIHIEYSYTPLYETVYVEGIANIYEFDAGELSGWTYHVNGVSPNVGMSAFYPEKGDNIEILYTCDLGRDVGNTFE